MSSSPQPRPRFRWSAAVPALATILCVGLYVELRFTVTRLQEAVVEHTEVVRNLDAAVQLLRIEQSSEGQGIDALLEKIRTFSPHLAQAGSMTFEYEERMDEILSAVKALGPDSIHQILAAYRDSKPGEADELRMWFARAAVRANPERAEEFLVVLLRGVDPDFRSLIITPRNRANAARELVELDKDRAGDVLAEIISYESHHGVNPARVPHHLKGKVPSVGMSGSSFENLVNWYLETDHRDTEAVTISILKSPEHKLLTKQLCIRELGERRSRAAADAIKRLYLKDLEAQGNPLFLSICLDSLGKILRGEACEFFREQQREVSNETVLIKLNALIVQYC